MLQIKNILGGTGGGIPEGSYVWKKYEFTPDPYLSFLGNEEFTLKNSNTSKNWDGTLEYSTDTITWNTWNGTEISSSGNNLYLRGTGNTRITGNLNHSEFVFTGTDALRISCEGNIENLLDYETVKAGNHPTMGDYCYYGMFYDCISLITVPELPATELASYCYASMFARCTSLTTPPSILPATTLAIGCYQYMFEFSAIDAIPKIMATTYVDESCVSMFDDIKTLNVYSSSGIGHTYGWTAPKYTSRYCRGMFGSDDSQAEWAKLDGSNFPNNGTPTDGTTYYFKTVA